MPRKHSWFIFLTALCLIAFGYAVYRDIRGEKHYYGADLRNRIVGARLIRDGYSPYFYKWEPGDGVRYYDPENYDSTHSERGKLSVITATPFFHHLLTPLTELPQRQLARIWLAMEYLMWLGMGALALLLTGTWPQRSAVLVVATLFLFTEAWKVHVAVGQYYLCIPFLTLLSYCLLRNNKNWLMGSAAGLIAVSMVLIRPNSVLYFIPFLWLLKNFTRSFLIAFFIPVFLLLAWTLLNKKEYSLWLDYRFAVAEHTNRHLQLDPFIPGGAYPGLITWEGVDQSEARDQVPIETDNEHGNFFLLYKAAFHRSLPLIVLEILSAGIILLLIATFWYSRRSRRLPGSPQPADSLSANLVLADRLSQAAIMGYCLYMVSDLFSPIYRWQYYTIQWMFPLLLAAAVYDRRDKWPFLLLLTGLGLNIINTNLTNLEHTLGEYLLLTGLISLSFAWKPPKNGLSYP